MKAGYDPLVQKEVSDYAKLFCGTIRIDAERLYRSGLIDTEAYKDKPGELAQVLLTAAILRNAEMFSRFMKAIDNKRINDLLDVK